MRKVLLVSAIFCASGPLAFANNYATNSPGVAQALGAGAPAAASNAHARAAAASASHSRSSATGGSATVNNYGGGGSGGYGGAVAQPFNPPPISTTNSCGGGISLGGFGVGGGGGGGALWELHDCRLRAAAVLLDARGDHQAAKGVWCQIDEVRKAYSETNEPCPGDDAKAQPISTTTNQTFSYAVPAWCATTSGKDPAKDRDTCLRALNANLVHLREPK